MLDAFQNTARGTVFVHVKLSCDLPEGVASQYSHQVDGHVPGLVEYPLLDRYRSHVFIAPFEKLALGAMTGIEALGVYAVDVSHAPGYVGIRGLDQQMIVVGHQAVRGDAKIPHLRVFDQYLDESLVIIFVVKDRLTSPAAVHDVIPGIRKFDS